jgi:hypothetical protein|tara:strand:- start:312 stop:596 length:285 start_codon:yes stop_codon:yes gene_type:complete
MKPNTIGKEGRKVNVPKPSQKNVEEARKFASTPRGQLILGQALAVASKVLKDKEPSNSDDMKFLGENLFGIFFHIYTNEDDVKSVLLDGGEVNE